VCVSIFIYLCVKREKEDEKGGRGNCYSQNKDPNKVIHCDNNAQN